MDVRLLVPLRRRIHAAGAAALLGPILWAAAVWAAPSWQNRPVAAGVQVPEGDRLDLNTATLEQLRALPGMGPEYARRIIAHRPYSAKNQLSTRGILPEPAYQRIAPWVVAHRSAKK